MHKLDARVPPVVLVGAAALLMWLIAVFIPSLGLTIPQHGLVAAAFVAVGALAAIAGIVEFRRARTTVDPTAPQTASALVTSGIYRVTRNPMYVGFALALLGWAVYLQNPLTLVIVAAFVAYMDRFQIRPEERALQTKFGAQFSGYTRKVRRWL